MYTLPEVLDVDEAEAEAEDVALEENARCGCVRKLYLCVFIPNTVRRARRFSHHIGKTVNDVQQRVLNQCKGSAIFEQPVVLAQWKVKRVGHLDLVIHKILASRGRWRENIPGTEWSNTNVAEIQSIIDFAGSNTDLTVH